MDKEDFILHDSDDKSTVLVSQGKKRKVDQAAIKSENCADMPSESDLTLTSTFERSSDDHQFKPAAKSVFKEEPNAYQVVEPMVEINDDPAKPAVTMTDTLWQCLLVKVLESQSKDNLNLMTVILVEISELLSRFNRLAERICQESVSDGDEISIKEYPLVQPVMPRNLPTLRVSNSMSLLSELQVELDIVQKANGSLQKKVKKKVRKVKKKGVANFNCKKKLQLAGENEHKKIHFSISQMVCEAILHSEEKELNFDDLVYSISTRHDDMKSKGRIEALRLTLKRNAHFVSSESGTERGNKSVRTVFSNEKTLFWSLSQRATEAILQGYNYDPQKIDFSKVEVPYLQPAEKSEIQQLIEDSEVSWQPFFLVDKETFSEMRRGIRPIQCPNCGKQYSTKTMKRHAKGELSSVERLVAHWKNNMCTKQFASLVAKVVIGLDKQQRFTCTHHECDNSQQTFSSVQAVQFHYNSKHKDSFEGKIWQCPQCDQDFITEGLLNMHVRRVHDTEKHAEKHICRFCGSTFTARESRNKHEKFNCLEAPADTTGWVECEFCGQKLRRSGLQNHKKCYHPEKVGFDKEEAKKQNTCKLCNKGFAKKYKLK